MIFNFMIVELAAIFQECNRNANINKINKNVFQYFDWLFIE